MLVFLIDFCSPTDPVALSAVCDDLESKTQNDYFLCSWEGVSDNFIV